MDKHQASCIQLMSFDKIYLNIIRPKLETLDIFLKENTSPFHVYEVANILEIEPDEVLTLMNTLQITALDADNIFKVILKGSSKLCHLISRQWKYTQTSLYTPEMIAEIYMLNIHKVKSAFAELGIELVSDVELLEVFKRIHLTIFSA